MRWSVHASSTSCVDNTVPVCPIEGGVVSTSDKSSRLKSRLESQSSESDLDGTINEEKDEPKKKKNRQHKKKQWASILRDRNLRVMSK